jgi:xylulokinase
MAFDRIVLTGGGSKSAAWRQMVADVFGLPVDVPQQAEGAAFGAALQALWSLRHEGDNTVSLAELAKEHVAAEPTQAARPDPSRVASYAAPYARFLEHLQAVRPLYE